MFEHKTETSDRDAVARVIDVDSKSKEIFDGVNAILIEKAAPLELNQRGYHKLYLNMCGALTGALSAAYGSKVALRIFRGVLDYEIAKIASAKGKKRPVQSETES